MQHRFLHFAQLPMKKRRQVHVRLQNHHAIRWLKERLCINYITDLCVFWIDFHRFPKHGLGVVVVALHILQQQRQIDVGTYERIESDNKCD